MWRCQREGSCCTVPKFVAMTRDERRVLEAATDRPLKWTLHEHPRFVNLVAGPCPLVDRHADGTTSCSVYEVRPVNCRRFGCFRDDPRRESFPANGILEVLRRRPDVLPQAQALQAEAQIWGDVHGWKGLQ